MNTNLINKISNTLNLKEAASVLGVSTATVLNWIRQDHISPISPGKLLFSIFDVEKLRDDVHTGVVNRLNKRANKGKANRTFIPIEYLDNINDQAQLRNIISFVQENNILLNEAMFFLSLNLLMREGLIPNISYENIPNHKKLFINKRQIYKEIVSWLNAILPISFDSTVGSFLLNASIPLHNDILGLLYQSLLAEGSKSKQGSYYTPPEIVNTITQQYAFKSVKFLDPCCGSGQFLLSFANVCNNPRNIYGFDIDNIAVRIARINLLIKFREEDFEPNVFCRNSILGINSDDLFASDDQRFQDFDVVATNPPWGVHFSREEIMQLNDKFPTIKSCESFSYFIKTSIDLLKKDGVLSFILPESILNVKTHQDIRQYIVDNTSIERITYLSRVFKNVFTPVIRLDLRKGQKSDHQVLIEKEDSNYQISQARLASNEGCVFNIHSDSADSIIIDKIYSFAHVTLEDKAKWALGIVTGDNDKYLLPDPVDGAEAILKGSDINKYVCKPARNYIIFNSNLFQQVAPEDRYRASEKLIYKFISKQLVFAYDEHKKLTLNSANIVIPMIDGYPIKAILALFNSCLYQFIFQKKFSSIKVLRSHIEQLPLPLWGEVELFELSKIADGIIAGKLTYSDADKFIFSQFNLNDIEIQHIRENVNGSIEE